jgi:hypothetical protein
MYGMSPAKTTFQRGDRISFTVGTARDGRTLAQDVQLEDESDVPEFVSR